MVERYQSRDHVIYGLYDPTDIVGREGWLKIEGVFVRYVGYSERPKRRIVAHIYEAKKSVKHNHRFHWLRSLMDRNIEPKFVILATCRKSERFNQERLWIAKFPLGQLVNSTSGGEGIPDLCLEGRARIGAASAVRMKGNTLRKNTVQSQATKDAISAGLLASEAAAQAWANRKGKPSYVRTDEIKKKNSVSNLGNARPGNAARLRKFNADRKGKTINITNGVENKQHFKDEPIPEGWRRGQTNHKEHHLSGKKNPVWSEILRREGAKRKGNMRWITNGDQTKMWMPGDPILDGWYFGKPNKAPRGPGGRFVPK